MTDYYDVLGVEPDATRAEIQRAYREKVKEHHPDVSDHPDAAERFRAIARAEEVLGDEAERDRYDRLGHDGYRRVVEDGVPEEHVESTADERATGGERGPDAADAGAAGGRTDRGGASSRAGGSGEAWQATGPSAGNDNPSQRGYSPWSSDDGDDGTTEDWWDDEPFRQGGGSTEDPGAGAASERTRRTGTTPSGGGSTPSADFGASTGAHRRRRQPRSETGTPDDIWSTDVDPAEVTTSGSTVFRDTFRSRKATMLTVAMLVTYPGFVYFTFTQSLPTVMNAVIGTATLAVVVFTLTEPGISLVVFGIWSLLSPGVLLFVGFPPLSLLGLAVMGAFWVPLCLAVVVAMALPG